MKREYMEELRALVDAIRREGKNRRRAVCEARWRFLSFLRGKRKLERDWFRCGHPGGYRRPDVPIGIE